MSFLPSVDCGIFMLQKDFPRGKILACPKKSEIFATSILKLIKMMLKCQERKPLPHACIVTIYACNACIVTINYELFTPRFSSLQY